MPLISDGGRPTTFLKDAIGTTPTILCIARTADTRRSVVTFQNVGTVPVYIGGPDVTASGSKQGTVLVPVADPTADQPHSWSNSTTPAAIYGIVASGTGVLQGYEEVYP